MAVRSVKVSLSLDGEKEWKKSMRSVNSEIKTLRAELDATNAQFAGQANSMAALQAKQDKLTALYAQQTQKVSDLRDALKRAETVYADAPEKLNYYRQSLAHAETSLYKLDAELRENTQYLEEAQNSADDCATSIDEFGKKVKKVASDASEANDSLHDTSDAVGDVGDSITRKQKAWGTFKEFLAANLTASAVVAGLKALAEAFRRLGGEIVDCVNYAAEFETSLAKVKTIADNTVVGIDQMSADILAMSNATGVAASALAESTYQAISASVATEDAVEAAGTASKLATAGYTDAATAIDALTTVVNSYGEAAGGMVNVSDHLLAVQNLGKTSVDELASSIGKVIPIASAYDVSLDDLSTGYALLTKNGVATAESTTYLKAMFNELGDSGSEIGKLLAEQTGKSFAQLQREGQSLYDVLAVLMDVAGGEADAFNNLWSSSEAGIGALTLVNAGAEEYAVTLDAMRNATGLTEQAYATMTDTFEFKTQRLQTVWANLKAQLGDEFLPSLSTFADGITQILTGNVDEGLALLEQGVDEFGLTLEELGPLAGEKLADLAEFLVEKGIPLLVEVGMDLISALIEGLATSLPELVPMAINMVVTLVEALLDPDNIQKLGEAASDLFWGFQQGLIKAIPEVVLAIPRIIKAIVEAIFGHIDSMEEAGEGLLQGLWNGMIRGLSGVWDTVAQIGSSIVGAFKDFFGIHSPASKHMPFMGKMIAAGVGVGWEDEVDRVTDEMADALAQSMNLSLDGVGAELALQQQITAAVGGVGSAAGSDYSAALSSIDQRVAQLANSFVVVLDDGTVVGKLAPRINAELGKLATREERRV